MSSMKRSRFDPRALRYGDHVQIVPKDDLYDRATVIALFKDEEDNYIAIAALDDVDLEDLSAEYTVGVLRIIGGRSFDGLLGGALLHGEEAEDWMQEYHNYIHAAGATCVTADKKPSRLPPKSSVALQVDGRLVIAQLKMRIAFGEIGEYWCELFSGTFKDTNEPVLVFYRKEGRDYLPMDHAAIDQVRQIYLRAIGPVEESLRSVEDEPEADKTDIDYC